jgi:hypothetical protein
LIKQPTVKAPPNNSRVDSKVKLGELQAGQQFVYVFGLGDDWAHLCTVEPDLVDPLQTVGIVPTAPTAYWGWGDMPDQYGRRWADDDRESALPPNLKLTDLPALRANWGPRRAKRTLS